MWISGAEAMWQHDEIKRHQTNENNNNDNDEKKETNKNKQTKQGKQKKRNKTKTQRRRTQSPAQKLFGLGMVGATTCQQEQHGSPIQHLLHKSVMHDCSVQGIHA